MNWRKLAVYLGLNAVVSAVVTLSVLALWDAAHRGSVVIPASSSVPQPPLAATSVALPAQSTSTPTIYEVRSGDTLGSIALGFDVSIDDILAANGLTDPNTLSVGQMLVIPVGGLPQATATPAPINVEGTPAAPPPTGTMIVQESPPQLAIRSITDAGNLATEKVTIMNLGGPVDLAGWTLHDSEGNVYAFPVLNLFQGGAVNVHTGVGRDTVTDLYWGQSGPMWQSGETATLVNPQGEAHTTFVAP